jgi:hypothetical protein
MLLLSDVNLQNTSISETDIIHINSLTTQPLTPHPLIDVFLMHAHVYTLITQRPFLFSYYNKLLANAMPHIFMFYERLIDNNQVTCYQST